MDIKVINSIIPRRQQYRAPRRPITDIFTPNDMTIDRSKCHRTVPMKVLVLGVGRTGTVCKFFQPHASYNVHRMSIILTFEGSNAGGIETLR
jgi:hypothetical protein